MKESDNIHDPAEKQDWKKRWHDIIFEADTPAGKTFDVILLVAIVLSLLALILESVPTLSSSLRNLLWYIELFFTALFTIEYILRIIVVEYKKKYILSFYGIIDLLSVLPTYLIIFISGAQYFMMIRTLRLLRVFRVLKMMRFLGEAKVLSSALKQSRIKILVFVFVVICLVFIMGTVMYVVEGPENGFTSIPISIYWCIVTLTTVGYGDISPRTPLGQMIASLIMITGYGIIAVPTGIVTAEISRASQGEIKQARCPNCGRGGHVTHAEYCKFCGEKL